LRSKIWTGCPHNYSGWL